MARKIVILLLISGVMAGCYSLKSTGAISDQLNTFVVEDFRNSALNAPPTIAQTFQEQLKEKITRESRLTLDDAEPDLRFSGTISSFAVTSVAPELNATTAFNRLEIAVNVTFENLRNPEDHWTQTFSHFLDFPSNENVLNVQDQLIDQIFDQVVEDIFNRAFSNW